MGTVDHEADEVVGEGRIERLPQRVQDALGELAGAAKEGLLALSVGVGLGVLHELMEAEVEEVVGPKGRHICDRTAVRHGHESGEVTLGGRRVPVSRPRARAVDSGGELELGTYKHFAARDQLADVMLERMLAGVSTRRYARTDSRQILQMDVGGLPHATFLKGIQLLGTEVLPQIRKELESD